MSTPRYAKRFEAVRKRCMGKILVPYDRIYFDIIKSIRTKWRYVYRNRDSTYCIQLTWRAVHAPRKIFNKIIVHQLCHIHNWQQGQGQTKHEKPWKDAVRRCGFDPNDLIAI